MRERHVPRDGEQLKLGLFRGVPWDGQTPRSLTRVGSGLFLRRKPPKAVRSVEDLEQLEFWPVDGPSRKKSPGLRPGASLLLEPGLTRRG